MPPAFDVLADILRPSLRDDDFETEKKVIIEEIRMYLDNPMSVAYEAAKTAHFGAHPLGNSILGTVDSITALTADQMREYFARRYSPANIVLAFAGKSRVGRTWSSWPIARCRALARAAGRRQATPVKGTVRSRRSSAPTTSSKRSSAFATDLPSKAKIVTPPTCSATILGDHTGSRLYWTLIDPGLADGAELSYQDYNQAGAFFTFLSCEPDETQANLERIGDVYQSAVTERLHRGRPRSGQEQGAGAAPFCGASGRWAGSGRSGSTGCTGTPTFPVEQELEAFSRVTLGRPAPAARRLAALAAHDRLGRADD